MMAERRTGTEGDVEGTAVLDALPDPVVVVGAGDVMRYVNVAAEEFLGSSGSFLVGRRLVELVPSDNPLFSLLGQAREAQARIREYGLVLESPRLGRRTVNVQVGPLGSGDALVVTFHERTIAQKIDRQLTHRHAARSVSAMAAMLAHEVKNPLSGIRGAAQLIEANASSEDRQLTRLICDECDRIVALVDRMEVFTDPRVAERSPVNIHAVLEHVRRIAQAGFARHVRIQERYDPSLPEVLGNRDQLVQIFLNLLKNAAEAVPESGGEILLGTSFQQGVRLAVPGTDRRLNLPLVITVQDNGPGIPEDLRAHLFDPFVTTKVNGTGLGLALVAKLVDDHGGIVEFDSGPGRTVFRVHLPVQRES